MTRHILQNKITRAAITILTVAGLFAAMGAGTMARADDPPKKGDGKVKFVVGPVTHTADNKNQKPKQDPPKKPDPGKGKQPGPKGN